MARVANSTKEAIELPAIDEQRINDAMNTITTIQSVYNEERDLVNQLLGKLKWQMLLENFPKPFGLLN